MNAPVTDRQLESQARPDPEAVKRERVWLDDADGDLLARRISAWLAMHRVRVGRLAEAAGTDRASLSRALHSKRPFPVYLALRICEYTDLAIVGDSVKFDPGWADEGADVSSQALE